MAASPLVAIGFVALLLLCSGFRAAEAAIGRPANANHDWLNEFRSVPKAQESPDGKLRSFSKKFEHTDDEGAHTYLRYSSTMAVGSFVEIDTFSVISSMCDAAQVVAKSTSEADLRQLEEAIARTPQKLLFGSEAWGCRDFGEKEEDDLPFYRRVTGSPLVDAHALTITIPTATASPFSFLGRTRFEFFSNSTAALSTDSKAEIKRRAEQGKFPSDGSTYGLGEAIDLINYNFDTATGKAATAEIVIAETTNAKVSCKECFFYVGGGFGFEFETDTFDPDSLTNKVPTELKYAKVWVGGLFSTSVNIEAVVNAAAEAALNFGSGVLLQKVSAGTLKYNESMPGDHDVKKITRKTFTIGVLPMWVDIYLPIFASASLSATKTATAAWGGFFRQV